MYCPECGARIPDNSQFCPECGAKLTPAASAQPQSTQEESPKSEPTPQPQAASQPAPQPQSAPQPQPAPQPTQQSPRKKSRSKAPLIIGIIVVIAAVCVLAAIMLFGGDDSESPSEAAEVITSNDVIELSKYLDYTEEALAAELGVEINPEGVYPSMDNCNFMCTDKVAIIIIDSENPGDELYSIYGIQLGTKESDISKILGSDFEYSEKNSYDFNDESLYWYDDVKTGTVLNIVCENSMVTNVTCMAGDVMEAAEEINREYFLGDDAETESETEPVEESVSGRSDSAASAVEDQAYMEYIKNYLSDFNQIRAADVDEFTDEELLDIYNELMDRLARVDVYDIGIDGMRSILSNSELKIMSEQTAENLPDNVVLDLYEELCEHENDTDGTWFADMRELYGLTSADDDYIIPDSNSRYLSASDLSGLTKNDLRLARNEIYARHGRIFDSADLDAYFRSKAWYNPTIPASRFTDSMLNDYEKKNAELIKSVENSR